MKPGCQKNPQNCLCMQLDDKKRKTMEEKPLFVHAKNTVIGSPANSHLHNLFQNVSFCHFVSQALEFHTVHLNILSKKDNSVLD